MAYNTEELKQQSIEVIKKHNLVFIGDIFGYTGFSKRAFYDHKLHECNAIKSALDKNRINMKVDMRAKWYESDNATLQIGLMKLIANDEEAHRLNGTKREIKHDTTDKQINIKIHR
jgi:hypothetical protein